MKKISVEQVETFKREVIAVCEKHGLAISHEDGHGGFLINVLDECHKRWWMSAVPVYPHQSESIKNCPFQLTEEERELRKSWQKHWGESNG